MTVCAGGAASFGAPPPHARAPPAHAQLPGGSHGPNQAAEAELQPLLRQRPRTAAELIVPTPTTPMESGTRALPTLAAMRSATNTEWLRCINVLCGESWRWRRQSLPVC